MCCVLLNGVLTNEWYGLRERLGIQLMLEIVSRNRLKWLGHVLRKDDGD